MICWYDNMFVNSCTCIIAIACMYLVQHFNHSMMEVIFCLTIFLLNPPSTIVQCSPVNNSFSLGRNRVRSQYSPAQIFCFICGGSWFMTKQFESTDWGTLLFQKDLPSSPQSSSSSLCFFFLVSASSPPVAPAESLLLLPRARSLSCTPTSNKSPKSGLARVVRALEAPRPPLPLAPLPRAIEFT